MKLNKTQISALAEKIVKDIKTPYREHNVAIRESVEYKNFFDTNDDCIMLDTLKQKHKLDEYKISMFKENIREVHFRPQLKEVPSVTTSMIENDIIIETIEDISVDILIETLVKKYTINV